MKSMFLFSVITQQQSRSEHAQSAPSGPTSLLKGLQQLVPVLIQSTEPSVDFHPALGLQFKVHSLPGVTSGHLNPSASQNPLLQYSDYDSSLKKSRD